MSFTTDGQSADASSDTVAPSCRPGAGRRSAGSAAFLRRLAAAVATAGSLAVLAASPGLSGADGVPAHLAVVDVFGNLSTDTSISQSLSVNAPGPQGIAVNKTTGDVYVSDRGFNRVTQFHADGSFVRAWGFDVALPAASPASSATAEVCTTVAGCKPGVATGVLPTNGLGGQLNGPAGVSINQDTGDVYVSDIGFNRVQEFTSSGGFVRAFGVDVVSSGVGNNPAQAAKQTLTVSATAGSYRLTFQGQTTSDLAFDATAATIAAALQGLTSVGSGNVSVTGTGPYTITFAGALTNSPQPLIVTADGSTPLSGAGASATIASSQTGSTGFEICTVASSCKAGTASALGGGFAGMGYLAVAPHGAPNAGNVLVAVTGTGGTPSLRVQEHTATGEFVRAFGKNVVAAGPDNTGTGFETCGAAQFDVCRAGATGSGAGEFSTDSLRRVVEDADGTAYTLEAAPNSSTGNFRVQRFTLTTGAVVPQGALDPAELSGTTNVGNSAQDASVDIAVDDDGDLYVAKNFAAGTGTPPTEIPRSYQNIGIQAQPRILKVDPQAGGGAGAVTDVLFANPGEQIVPPSTIVATLGNVAGLAIHPDGRPLYVLGTAGAQLSQVFKLDVVDGLDATASVSDVQAASATLHAEITPAHTRPPSSYHFEYSTGGSDWIRLTENDITIGNGSGSGDPSHCPTDDPPTCQLSASLDNLSVGKSYQYRVVASSVYHGKLAVTEPQSFSTHATPPLAETGVAVWSGPPATQPQLTLHGAINPEALHTTYHFDYVRQADYLATGWANADRVPRSDADAGHGVATVDVAATAAGLDPGTTWRYRLVATNAEGTPAPQEQTVAPADPSGRYYELVSNGDSQGTDLPALRLDVSDDGDRAVFTAAAFGDQPSAPFIDNPNVAVRGPSAWQAHSMNPAPDQAVGISGSGDASLTKRLWSGASSEDGRSGTTQWVFRSLDGSLTNASPPIHPIDTVGPLNGYDVLGGSADLSTFVFAVNAAAVYGFNAAAGARLDADEPVIVPVVNEGLKYSNLYAVTGAGTDAATVHVVNRDAANAVIGGTCGARLGAIQAQGFPGTTADQQKTRAVSADGRVVYFSVRSGASPAGTCDTAKRARIFKRIDQTTTVAISASQCPLTCSSTDGDDYYWTASADGSKAFFTTTRQLKSEDSDATNDLYLYDATPPDGQPTLVDISAGELVPGPAVGDPPAHAVGAGAGVRGVVDAAVDGSRVYFVATGRLTSEATQGANNLYVYQRDADHPAGRLAYVTQLAAGATDASRDSDLWYSASNGNSTRRPVYALPFYETAGNGQRIDGDGHVLLFNSERPLVSEDLDAADDVYRYDDDTATMQCLSCVGQRDIPAMLWGSISSAGADAVQMVRVASEDARSVVFTTDEPLLAEDTNTAHDVYLWRDGQLTLISGASGRDGIVPAYGTGFSGAAISPDGRSVFFETRASITADDRDNGGMDFYVSRTAGGSPAPATASPCDVLATGGCQVGPPIAPPPPVATAAPQPAVRAASRGQLTVRRPTLSQRRLLAAGRRVSLRVDVNRDGRIGVTGTAPIAKRTTTVFAGALAAKAAGRYHIAIRLNRAGRRRLRAVRRLMVTLTVRFGPLLEPYRSRIAIEGASRQRSVIVQHARRATR
ncbi:MAG: hypothetical protein ACJ762_06250 [Solirubrobacteraceae bacterium]